MSEGEEGGRGGASTTAAPKNPPKRSRMPTPSVPAPKKRKFSFESSDESDDGAIHRPKKPNPPPHHHSTAYEGGPRPQTHQPPQDRHRKTPPQHQDRHPQVCRKEGRPSRGSDRWDGRPHTLISRGREGHRPWYPRAGVRCRLGGIPGRHHPLRGEPLPALPQPQGGRAAPGRGPGSEQEEGQTPIPTPTNKASNPPNANPTTKPTHSTNSTNPTNPPSGPAKLWDPTTGSHEV